MATSAYSHRSGRNSIASFFAMVVLLIVVLAGRAQATTYTFDDFLTGLQEVPPHASPGTGEITGTYDDVTNTFDFSLTFSGLSGTTTAAHLHSPAPPGVNAPVQIPLTGFPLNVTSGSYANTFIFTASQETNFLSGLMYTNIHTNVWPGGEIRAQLSPRLSVPESGGTFALLGLSIVGLIAFSRRLSGSSIRVS